MRNEGVTWAFKLACFLCALKNRLELTFSTWLGLMSGWCTIESDPGVFTELISEFGVGGVQVEELYSLDVDSMCALGSVHGLIFLFRWRQERDDRPVVAELEESLFFAQQMITNACATQAILAILLNRPNIELGEELSAFKAFTKDFSPELKGLAIANSELLRKAHKSFARAELSVGEDRQVTRDDDVYHFISYVPLRGKLWELDGLKSGPICLGEASDENWLQVVLPIIQKRIQANSKEITFNLMGIIADRRIALLEQQTAVEKERNMTVGKIQARSGKLPTPAELEKLAADSPPPPPMGEVAVDERTVDELLVALAHLSERSASLSRDIELASRRTEQWKVENRRRKHNYIPFISNVLKLLAERGELLPLIDAAKARNVKRAMLRKA